LSALREEVEALTDAPDDPERPVGEVLFAAVAAARKLGVDAETALRRTTGEFADRYEGFIAKDGRERTDIDEDDVRRVFRAERGG
jgi:uncharacterized protein YabN with tetrapyrrole methylase and pyrophosphatase domain